MLLMLVLKRIVNTVQSDSVSGNRITIGIEIERAHVLSANGHIEWRWSHPQERERPYLVPGIFQERDSDNHLKVIANSQQKAIRYCRGHPLGTILRLITKFHSMR